MSWCSVQKKLQNLKIHCNKLPRRLSSFMYWLNTLPESFMRYGFLANSHCPLWSGFIVLINAMSSTNIIITDISGGGKFTSLWFWWILWNHRITTRELGAWRGRAVLRSCWSYPRGEDLQVSNDKRHYWRRKVRQC